MPTIQDVARLAGVAPITASRVVNNSGYASPSVRERVLQAAANLGYVPNTLARSLRSRKSNTLALVLSDITNPFFTTIARGVEDTASDAGYTVIFCNTDESEAEEQKYLNVLLQKRVDGILLVPAGSGERAIRAAREQNTAVVVIDRRVSGETVDVVRCDSEAGARCLTELLLELGHQRIALLTGSAAVSTAVDRAAGFRAAMAQAGLACDELVFYGSYTQSSGAAMVRQVLALDPRPTALFAANNFIAIGALNALRELGLRVPEDMALVAFDDLPAALVTFPFLTVASQPAYEMGCRATHCLLERLENPAGTDWREDILPIEIILRASSGEKRHPITHPRPNGAGTRGDLGIENRYTGE
jgi:LacI family transcriptional regulator